MINKSNILYRTHYGLDIYAYILSLYYPGQTILSLSGRDCSPTFNPFNGGKKSLLISIKDSLAQHSDASNAIPKGDVFDFASLHFQASGDSLLHRINYALDLKISVDDQNTNDDSLEIELNSNSRRTPISIPQFSYFNHPITNTTPARTVNLLEVYQFIKNPLFKTQTEQLRQISDHALQRKFKASSFDYVTFSGTFSSRSDKNLINHAGLITLDFDHISDTQELKSILLNDSQFDTELIFISPSGNGLKWIIKIDLEIATHQQYFEGIKNYLSSNYQLKIDASGKDTSRACFIPHDSQVYINPNYL